MSAPWVGLMIWLLLNLAVAHEVYSEHKRRTRRGDHR